MTTNRAFVVIQPECSTPEFIAFTREYFAEHDIKVEEEREVSRDELVRNRWVDRHHALEQTYALADSAQLSTLIHHSEDVKSRFFYIYSELWDTVMEEGRLLTAKDALTVLGDLSPSQLSGKWWSAFQPQRTMQQAYTAPVKLVAGLYVARLGDAPYYVVNGFYPALAECWNLGPRRNSRHTVTWMAIAWPESKFSWRRAHEEVFGVLDPETAHSSSLRRIMHDRYDEFKIYRRPSLERSGFCVSSGPVEAIAQYCLWTRRPISDVSFGRQLLQEKLPPLFLERILSNPLLISSGAVSSVYDTTSAMSNSQAVRRLAELYHSLKEAEQEEPPTLLACDPLQEGKAIRLTEGCDEEVSKQRNSAVVFIKPHAYTKLFCVAAEEFLSQNIPGLSIDRVQDVDAHLVEARSLLDRHYGVIAHYATMSDPTTVEVSNGGILAFEDTFGVRWRDVVASGRLWSATSALQLLGHISPEALYEMWNAEPTKVKLTSGAYVCHLPLEGGGAYILNGFYPMIKKVFTEPGRYTHCWSISWPESSLSWKSFREDVIGCTNPAKAKPTSLRGMLYSQWRALEVDAAPDTTLNGIHASAGPIEGMVERHLWFGIPYEQDVLTQQVIRSGFSPSTLLRWAGNPEVEVDLSSKQRVFDALENKETSEVVALMRDPESIVKDEDAEPAINRAVVVLHPHATTARTIALVTDVLQRANITVLQSRSIFAHEATAAILDTPLIRRIASLSCLSGPALMAAVSPESIQAFEDAFEVPWEEVVESVVGAEEALETLQVSPFELVRVCAECGQQRQLDAHLSVAYLKPHNLYVVNGDYPFQSEMYTTPGSRIHLFEVAWPEEQWEWRDVSDVIIGARNISTAAAGSLQRILSENWKEFSLPRRAVYPVQASITISLGPLEAVEDRLRWFTSPLERTQRAREDPFVQQLLLAGVSMDAVMYLMEGKHLLESQKAKAQQRELDLYLSIGQQCSTTIERVAKFNDFLRDSLRREYGFMWLQPSACTERGMEELKAFLTARHIRIEESGVISADVAAKRRLLTAPTDPLYRNAMLRSATQMPVTDRQRGLFRECFRMEWTTAVQLSLVMNCEQFMERVGQTSAVEMWEAAEKKVCLSDDLYVAYIASEGLYVVNGFFSFTSGRLYNGPQVLWLSLSWEAEVWDYEQFLEEVIGDINPETAVEGSFRSLLLKNWKEWNLPTLPDTLESGVTVSPSPIAALAERCRWLSQSVDEDVLGISLIRSGVHATFLHNASQNPLAHLKGDSLSGVTEMFHLLPSTSEGLSSTLKALQSSYELTFLPQDSILTPQRPDALRRIDDDGLWTIPFAYTEEEVEAFKSLTAVLRRGTSSAYEYFAPFEPSIPSAGRQWWLAGERLDTTLLGTNYAVISLSPAYESQVSVDLLKDLLSAHAIKVLVDRKMPGREAEGRHIFDAQFERLMRHTLQSSDDSQGDATREAFERSSGISVDGSVVMSALELASEFNLNAHKVLRVWDLCTHATRLAPDCFIAKVPTENILLINGFALKFQEDFLNPSVPKRFLLVSWDSKSLSYKKFSSDVIGDTFVKEASPISFHGVLRDSWTAFGLPNGPHPFMGAVSASESAIQCMQQRQAWFGAGLLTDPLGRRALSTDVVSPLVLRRALRNQELPDGNRLFDVLRGEDAAAALNYLKEEEQTYRQQPTRNTAFALLKPHALGKRFARRVEHNLAKHSIRIEEQGDISGSAVHERGLVRYLYPAAAGYAVRPPGSLILSEEEQQRLYAALSVTWEEFVLSDMLLGAYKALEVLGGITPQQLYVMWKASRHRVLIRPDLEITELEDHHLFVVNAFFPALKESFETPGALLHWYVLSWDESKLSWADFNTKVIGARQPSRAEGGSIRSHLYRHWIDYGLHAIPDRILNGIHASEGPLQGLGERLTFLERPISEDPLGEVLDRMQIPSLLLDSWLDNIDVRVGHTTAGVLEHLVGYDTSRLIRTMEFLSDDMKAREASRIAGIPYQTPSMAPEESSLCEVESEVPEEDEETEVVETMNMSWRSDIPWTEEPIVYRNTSVLIMKPHVSGQQEVKKMMEAVLKRHNVRVLQYVERESSARLIDRLQFTEAFFALRSNIVEVLKDGGEVAQSTRLQFREVFEEPWMEVVEDSPSRLLSAVDAMALLRLSAQELYVKSTGVGRQAIKIGEDIEIVKVHGSDAKPIYVVNPSYLYRRQRLERVESNNVLGIFVVSFDGREHTWKDFRTEVIGDEDPSKAMEGSFRCDLYEQWKALGLSAEPSVVDNGVEDSTSPLTAFAKRLTLFGCSDLIPDPLVRSMCMAEADPLLLVDWSENPLVAYTSSYSHGETRDENVKPKVCRIFDLLHEIDTRDLSELIRTAETHIRVISRIKDLRLPDLQPQRFRPRPPASTEGSQSTAKADRRPTKSHDTKASANPPVAPPPRTRQKIDAARIQDAIINAQSADDVGDLWAYYRENAPAGVEHHYSAAGFGRLVDEPEMIQSAVFYRDFSALDPFGLPLDASGSELSKIFIHADQEGGVMNFNEFARALALYQTI